jgi:predicted nucleic acid-binding protein
VTLYVLDASAMLAWCFEDERPEGGAALLDTLTTGGLVVPAHWSFEVSNTLLMAQRRGRLAPQDAEAFANLVEALQPNVDALSGAHALHETRRLAADFGLTVYDAAYLELARRRQAVLVSKDKSLLAAASRAGVEVLAI